MNKKPKIPTAFNYLFEDTYDSEANMKMNEIQGPKQSDESSEELDESLLNEFYEQMMDKTDDLGLNSQKLSKQHIIRPTLHYKEAYISGDIYPHMTRNQAQNGTCPNRINVVLFIHVVDILL